MKKIIPIIGLILISDVCFSQISTGIDYVLNIDGARKYSNSLNGLDLNFKCYLSDRVNISSSLTLYKNYNTRQITYKNWGVNLNGGIDFLKKNLLNLYGIVGLEFQQESAVQKGILIDPLIESDLKKKVLAINLGLGSDYKITKNIWFKLNILTNSSYQIIINSGLLYRFDLKRK